MSPSITRPGLQQLFSHHIELSKLIKYAPTAPALGLVSMMLHYVIVKTAVLVGLTGMHKTGCSGETRLVLHVPSSS